MAQQQTDATLDRATAQPVWGRGGSENPVVARMVGAAQGWLRQRGMNQSPATVASLSEADYAALKAEMFHAVEDDLATHPDLDRAIACLQALGELARAQAAGGR